LILGLDIKERNLF